MPLMPMPPTPTKCMRRVLPSIAAAQLAPPRHRAIDDDPRGVGPRQRPRRGRHARSRDRDRPPAPSIASASASPVSSRCTMTIRRARRPSTSAFLRWWSSVAVGSGIRIDAFARRRHLRQRGRAGAAHDQVRRLHLAVHVVEERLDAGRQPGRSVRGAHHLQIALARLVGDRKAYPGGCQPRRRLHHGHVDRVRALRAAKDQTRAASCGCDRDRLIVAGPRSPPRKTPAAPDCRPRTPCAGKNANVDSKVTAAARDHARQQPIGQARHRVLLEQHRRDSRAAPRQRPPDPSCIRRRRPPGRAGASQIMRHASSGPSGSSANPTRRSTPRLALESGDANHVELEPFARHHPRFDALRGAGKRHRASTDRARSSSRATAMPGYRCPPVPPPAITTRTASRGSRLHLRVLRNVQQHAHAEQVDQQRRSAGADERQRNALGRHQAEHDADVHERLHARASS